MNTKNISQRIIHEAKGWTLWDWKKFRCLDGYWDINDDYVFRLNKLSQEKDYFRRDRLENEFKLWKLKRMIKYNTKKQIPK